MQILIIDDEHFHRERLASELKGLGFGVLTASDPQGALAMLRKTLPDLAAIEPVLPGMSWVRFLRALCAASPGLRWTVVTAFPSEALVAEATKLGALAVLLKPVRGEDLMGIRMGRIHGSIPSTCSDLSLARLEWEHLNRVLSICEGNMTRAARELGIPRQTLYNRLKKAPRYHLD